MRSSLLLARRCCQPSLHWRSLTRRNPFPQRTLQQQSTPAFSSTTTTAPTDDWATRTDRVLNDLSLFDSSDASEVHACLRHWLQQKEDPHAAVSICLKLLPNLSPQNMTQQDLHAVVQLWSLDPDRIPALQLYKQLSLLPTEPSPDTLRWILHHSDTDAFSILSQFQEATLDDYHTVLRNLVFHPKGWDLATQLVERVQALATFETYELYLHVWAQQVHKVHRIDRALQILDLFRERGWEPTEKIYDTLVVILCKAGQQERAEEFLADLETPTHQVYQRVLDSYYRQAPTDPEAPRKLDRLLHTMIDRLGPSRFALSIALAAWSKSSNSEAPQRAKYWLQQMQLFHEQGIEDVRPTVENYGSVIRVAGKHRAMELVEQAWKQMQEDFANGNDQARPDILTYNVLLHAWASSERQYAVAKAESILQELKDLESRGETWARPNKITYSSVMTVLTRCGQDSLQTARRVQALFDELQAAYETTGDPQLRPAGYNYSGVIQAWAHAKRPDKAEEMIKAMIEDYLNGNESAVPTTLLLNQVLFGYEQARRKDSHIRAFDLVGSMMDLHRMHNWDIKPDASSANLLLATWDAVAGPAATEEVFRKLQAISDADFLDSKAYRAVMTAWARSKTKDAAARVESIFREMRDLYIRGNAKLAPGAADYTPRLTVYGRDRQLAKAEAAFNEMIGYWKAGDDRFRPTPVQYAAMLNVYKDLGSAKRALTLLDQMIDGATNGRNPGSEPNDHAYGAVILAIRKSTRSDRYEQARRVVDRMIQRAVDGYFARGPSEVPFCNLISILNGSRDPNAGLEAEKVLREMDKLVRDHGMNCRPRESSYTTAMKVWNKSRHPDKFEHVERLFHEALALAKQDLLQPDRYLVSAYLECLIAERQARKQHLELAFIVLKKYKIKRDTMMSRQIKVLSKKLAKEGNDRASSPRRDTSLND